MGHSPHAAQVLLKAYAWSHLGGYGQPQQTLPTPAELQQNPTANSATTGSPAPLAAIDLAQGSWQGPPAFKQGEVAKRLGNGLQNRYTPVRIRSSPLLCPS